MDNVAVDVLVRLGTAKMSLEAAIDAAPEHEETIRERLLDAVRQVSIVEGICKRRLGLEAKDA
jgi:dihydroxyacetone kinase DhaKLM complex PTS-EIIA-like component DhaM